MSWPAAYSGVSGETARMNLSRVKLLLLLPLTMGSLVAATGFFVLNMARRTYILHGPLSPDVARLLDQLGWQALLVALIAAILGVGLAIGLTTPLKLFADRLEAVASGNLRAALDPKSTPDVDWLAGAFNDAVAKINRYVFQSMTGAVITLNPEAVIVGASPATEVILGYREEDITGQPFSGVFAPSGGRAELAAIESAIARREVVSREGVIIAAQDGRSVTTDISVSYLRRGGSGPEADEEAIALTITFRDQSEIRRLRDHLQKADQLVALGTLTAGVAHELRNPLASLRGLTELLGRDFEESDPRRRYVTTMLESIDRLNTLVENLLLLSSKHGKTEEEVDVLSLIQELAAFARYGLADRHVTVSVDPLSERVHSRVMASRHRLEQALSNIVLNAIQATPDGGSVTLKVTLADRHVVVFVHNTGSYIPPERMKQLFVPFFTTRPSGTGLGLAIARQIVTAYGGRIGVESDRLAGTTFSVDLPLAGSDSAWFPTETGTGPLLIASRPSM
jgi:two-component system, NtrC family, sensor histidine kinase AtoS